LLQGGVVSRSAGQAALGAPACQAGELAIVVAVPAASLVAKSTAVGQPSALGATDERASLPLEEPIQGARATIRHLLSEGEGAQAIHVRVVS